MPLYLSTAGFVKYIIPCQSFAPLTRISDEAGNCNLLLLKHLADRTWKYAMQNPLALGKKRVLPQHPVKRARKTHHVDQRAAGFIPAVFLQQEMPASA
jgi:hypothetical protein